jgi:hypothetical protein
VIDVVPNGPGLEDTGHIEIVPGIETSGGVGEVSDVDTAGHSARFGTEFA